MKKIISLLITAAMLLSLVTVSAFAANGPMPTNPEGWYGARIGFTGIEDEESAYVVQDEGKGLVIDNSAYPGATYDKATNTLTLTDVAAADASLFVGYMGDDFTIRVEGDCEIGAINIYNQFGIYSTSLHLTGTGSLTLNEKRQRGVAISMWNEGDGSDGAGDLTRLTVDESVTLHLYSGAYSDSVAQVIFTKAGTSAEAISVGGKAVEGVVGEKVYYTEYDEVPLMIVNNTTDTYTHGYAAKSKADPDGMYAVEYWSEEGTRWVSHYVWLDDLGLWVADPGFDDYSDQKSYAKEEFEQEYSIIQSSQPAKIRYTSDQMVEERGRMGVLLTKADEPGVVYCASPIWYNTEDDPESYYIYRVTWSEEEGRYIDEPNFHRSVNAEDMESEGFGFVYETVTREKEFTVWSSPAPFDDDNWQNHLTQIRCASDPDSIYVKTGDSYSTDGDGNREKESLIVQKVLYDADADEYYLTGEYQDNIYVPVEEVGDEYSIVYETVTVKKEIRHINADYSYNDYSNEALLCEKAGDTSPYCARIYTDSDGEKEYTVNKLELRGDGHYYAVKWQPSDDVVYGHVMDEDDFAEKGYSFVMADQDTPFTVVGDVDFYTMRVYTDNKGGYYATTWSDEFYSYDPQGKSVTFGDTTYYYGYPTDKTEKDLNSTARKIDTGCYSYYLKGTEYHHEGTGTAPTALLGDVDGDEKISILDATAIQRHLVKLPTASFNEKAADADESGKIEILDATAIQRYLVNLSTHEGIGVKRV